MKQALAACAAGIALLAAGPVAATPLDISLTPLHENFDAAGIGTVGDIRRANAGGTAGTAGRTFRDLTQFEVIETGGSIATIRHGATVDGRTIRCLNNTGACVDMDGNNRNGGRLQTDRDLLLHAGDYVLTFHASWNQRNHDTERLRVQLADVWSQQFTFAETDAATPGLGPFRKIEINIQVATQRTGRLVFEDLGGDNIGLILDGIKLERRTAMAGATQVPAPATLAVLGLGLTALGLRRRARGR